MPTEPILWTENIAKEILDALVKKAPQPGTCPICQNKAWGLQPGFAYFVLQNQLGSIQIGGPGLPCVALTCTNCGNTQFINVIVLGLRHLLEKPTAEQKVG